MLTTKEIQDIRTRADDQFPDGTPLSITKAEIVALCDTALDALEDTCRLDWMDVHADLLPWLPNGSVRDAIDNATTTQMYQEQLPYG